MKDFHKISSNLIKIEFIVVDCCLCCLKKPKPKLKLKREQFCDSSDLNLLILSKY